jgi:hypothetical protein
MTGGELTHGCGPDIGGRLVVVLPHLLVRHGSGGFGWFGFGKTRKISSPFPVVTTTSI